MKKMTKILLAAGGAALICGGAVMTYLKAQTPMSAQEELTLANLEAMALDLDEDLDQKPGGNKNIYSYREWFSEDCYVLVGGAYAKGKKITCFSGTEHPICVDCKL